MKNIFKKFAGVVPSLLLCGFVAGALFVPDGSKFDNGGRVVVTLAFAVLALVIFGWSFAAQWLRRGKKVGGPGLSETVFLSIFVGWTLVSFLLAQTANFGFSEVLMLASVALLFCARRDFWKPKFLAIFGLLLLLASSVGGYFLYLVSHHERAFGFFYNPAVKTDAWPNAFALFVILLWPILCGWKAGRPVVVKVLFMSVVFAVFLLTFSRAGLLVLAVQVIILGVYFLMQRKAGVVWKKLLAAVGVIVVTVVFVGGAQYLRANFFQKSTIQFTDKLKFSNNEQETSIQERLDFFKGGIQLASQQPLFGYGPMSFSYVYRSIQKDWLAISDHPHNVFIKIAAESGLPALVAFMALLLIIFVKVVKNFRKVTAEKKLWLVMLSIGFLGALTHNLVDYNLNFATNFIIFWLMLMFIDEFATVKKTMGGMVIKFFTGAIFILVLCLTAWGVYGIVAIRQVDSPQLLTAYAGVPYPRYGLLEAAERAVKANDKNLAEQFYLLEIQKNPWDAMSYNRLGELQMQRFKTQKALEYFNDALRLDHKNFWVYYFNKLRALQILHRKIELKIFSAEILAEMQQYVPKVEANIHYTAQNDNSRYAKQILEILINIDPQNKTVLQGLLARVKKAVAQYHI